MNSAVVISKAGERTTLIRSDTVAAKTLQNAIATDKVENGEERHGEGGERADRSDELATLRSKVTALGEALHALRVVLQRIGPEKAILALSKDRAALAFAGRMLGEIAAEERRVSAVADGDDKGESDDVGATYEISVGGAEVWLRALEDGEAVDMSGLHGEVILASEHAATSGAAGAEHDGEALVLFFGGGERLRLLHAALAGSIVIRGGGQSVTVRAMPSAPDTHVFDVTL